MPTSERRRSEQSIYIYGVRRHVIEGLKYIVEWNGTITPPHQEWTRDVGIRPRERQCLEKEGKGRGLPVRILAVMSSVGFHIVENVPSETCS